LLELRFMGMLKVRSSSADSSNMRLINLRRASMTDVGVVM